MILAVRVGAGAIGGGCDALLGEFGDPPVLAIRDVPELDGPGSVEPLAGERFFTEQPVATDHGAADPEGAHEVADHVVRMEAEQRVRQQDFVAHATPELGR